MRLHPWPILLTHTIHLITHHYHYQLCCVKQSSHQLKAFKSYYLKCSLTYQETFGWQDVKHHIEIFHRSLLDNHFTVYYLSTLVGVAFFERHDSKSWVIILRLRISKSHTMCHVMSQYTMGHDGSHTHTQWVLDVVFMMLCWKLAFIGLNFVCFENGPIRKENKNCRVRSFPALCSMLLYAPYYSGIAEVAWIWTTVYLMLTSLDTIQSIVYACYSS